MARILVTGGSGFVGAHVVRRLIKDNHEVTVFAPGPEPCLSEHDLADIMLIEGSVEDDEALTSTLAIARPEFVVGLAAYGGSGNGLLAAARENEASALSVNVGGFRNLLAACEERGVERLFWASMLAVYGAPHHYGPDPVNEEAPRLPETFYGLTKVLAEDVAGFYRDVKGVPVTGLRLPVIFGAGLWYRGAATQLVNLFQAAADGGSTALEVSTIPLDLMYVKDVAEAFARVITHKGPLDAIYNLQAYAPSLHEIVAVLKGLSPNLEVTTTDIHPALTYPLVSGQKFTDHVGYTATYSLETACADSISDLRNAP